MRKSTQFLAAMGLLLSLGSICGGAEAQSLSDAQNSSVAKFYRSHDLNVIVGYSAGGGFDVYARLLAQHISDYIPGHPRVVVENMPGAGGLKAALYLLNSAPRDGSY